MKYLYTISSAIYELKYIPYAYLAIDEEVFIINFLGFSCKHKLKNKNAIIADCIEQWSAKAFTFEKV